MTCRSVTAIALLLSLCLAPVAGATAASGATVDSKRAMPAGDPAFTAEVTAAMVQASSGDSLGASIAFERLLTDPRLGTVSVAAQSHVWAVAAMVAAEQKQPELAAQRLQAALVIDPHNTNARLRLAEHALYKKQSEIAADHVILALADADEMLDLPNEMAWHLDTALKLLPAKRLALLQALFDNGWTYDGIEPVELWVTLATLQVETGQSGKVAATLERIDSPSALMRLRSDKRFDRYLRRDDPRYDPVAAARRHIDRLRVSAMLSPGLNETAVELTGALMMAGESQEVIGMTNTLADAAAEARGAPQAEARYIAWMLDNRGRAFRRLGRNDDAVATQLLAIRMTDPQGDTVSQNLNLAALYVALHRPLMARETMRGLGELSPYGDSTQALIELRAALQLKDVAAAQRARERLLANRGDTPSHYREALMIDNRMDEAAALLIGQLTDPMERGTTLLELQDVRRAPVLPADAELHASWEQLRQRADVQAAVRRVGRIDTYPLFVN
jgi:tetratricopeptide (TPR) repeat protein